MKYIRALCSEQDLPWGKTIKSVPSLLGIYQCWRREEGNTQCQPLPVLKKLGQHRDILVKCTAQRQKFTKRLRPTQGIIELFHSPLQQLWPILGSFISSYCLILGKTPLSKDKQTERRGKARLRYGMALGISG